MFTFIMIFGIICILWQGIGLINDILRGEDD